MDRSEKITLTNMCMIVDHGKVLTIDRQSKHWPGLAFPGGHVEAHESFYHSVVREVKEETGLDIKHPKLVGVKQFFDQEDQRYIVFFYRADEFTGEIKASREGPLAWIKLEDLGQYHLARNFDQDLKLFLDPDLDEHLLLDHKDYMY